MSRPTAILCADLHLREDTPTCRNDDYFAAMTRKVDMIAAMQREYDCPVICAGDVFHTWRCSLELVLWAYEHLPNKMICVAGQHELPYHKLDNARQSPLGLLDAVGKIVFLRSEQIEYEGLRIKGASWGIEHGPHEKDCDIFVTHKLVYCGDVPFPGAPVEGNARVFMKGCGFAKLVVTGDNHKPFTYDTDNRSLLVNCGSMMRSEVRQHDYKPAVWLWHKEENGVESIPLPISKGVVDQVGHLDKQDRDERITDFVKKLGDIEVTLDYRQNVERFLSSEDVSEGVATIVRRCIDV